MKPERRTWQFWVWGFVFIFLAHALAVLHFGERQLPVMPSGKTQPFFYLSLDEESDRYLAELTLGRDPTLFALPNPHGFSGGAWLKFQPDMPRLSNWSAQPEWLTLSPERLSYSLDDYIATNRPSEEQLLASLRATRNIELRIPDEPLLTQTVARAEGALAGRTITYAPPLPPAIHSEVLHPTVVTVSVNGDGLVESASLSGERGLKQADEQALQLARRFEFQPLPIRDVKARGAAAPTIGRLIFIWQVLNSTNNGPATASTR
jgi:TonB family protein